MQNLHFKKKDTKLEGNNSGRRRRPVGNREGQE
jgi:hypothetical protein